MSRPVHYVWLYSAVEVKQAEEESLSPCVIGKQLGNIVHCCLCPVPPLSPHSGTCINTHCG